MKDKGNNISVFELFKQLQLEWIQAELRRKIYPLVKDKEYWTRVMEGKKRKIEDIANRNGLPSIFSNKENMDFYKGMIYSQEGYPAFSYVNMPDEARKKELMDKDFKYYYSVGADIKVREGGEILIGKIIDTPNVGYVCILLTGNITPTQFEITKITRIL